jgi:hypothetical protein
MLLCTRGPNEFKVTREFDDVHKVGEPVCICLHPGALGLSRHIARDCVNRPQVPMQTALTYRRA